MRLAEITELVGGRLEGDPRREITGLATLQEAGPADISFVASPRYTPYLCTCRAGAVLVSAELADEVPTATPRVVVADAHRAVARLLAAFHPDVPSPAEIHPTAIIHPSAELDPDVGIGAWGVVEEGVHLAPGVRVGAQCHLARGSRIGAGTRLFPQVTLGEGVHIGARCVIQSGARVGAEGFGYVFENGGYRRVRHVGSVRVGDDVEIGANTTIDRGSIGDTVVGEGTKIDNLVQIGHNVQMGRHVLVVSQVGISGSTVVGDGAVLGGQAGFGGHLHVGDGARVGAQAGVTRDVAAGETVSGYPARPHREALRMQAEVARLPKLVQRLRAVERSVAGDDGRDG
ncbi:UDP-3-O-(3-hydroxymyristoyl)glucosamine N-acyltransferase [soil metagenome]